MYSLQKVTVVLSYLIGLVFSYHSYAFGPGNDVVDSWFSELEKSNFSGQVLVAYKGQVLRKASFGMANREKKIPFRDGTIVDIGSITKQFVAVGIMQLQYDGKLAVSDKLSKYFSSINNDLKEVTIHQLLTHTSGLPQNIGFIYEKLSRNQLKDIVFKKGFELSENGSFLYSNIGFSLLALILEEVSGEDYEVFLQKNIFAPSGLESTAYRFLERNPNDLAVSYGRDANFVEKLFSLVPKSRSIGHSLQHQYDNPGPRWNMEGAGGLLSTVSDMYRWYLIMRERKLLNDNSWETIFTPYTPMNDAKTEFYGYGWGITINNNNCKKLFHSGSNGYSYADYSFYPELDLLIFYATNNLDDSPKTLLDQLDNLVIEEILQKNVSQH